MRQELGNEELNDDSPTDELPVLSEVDVVQEIERSSPGDGDDEETGKHAILSGATAARALRIAEADAPAATDLRAVGSRSPGPVPVAPGPYTEHEPERAEAPSPQAPELTARLAAAAAELAEQEATIASLEERLQATRQAVLRRDQLERQLRAELAQRDAALAEIAARGPAPPTASDALREAREEAAALAGYIANRRARWEEMQQQLAEQKARIAELEQELDQRMLREHRAVELAEAQSQRVGVLEQEIEKLRILLDARSAAPRRAIRRAGRNAAAPGPLPTAPTSERMRPAAFPALVCLTAERPLEYRLATAVATIGRGAHCDIQIPTHFVSREHARLIVEAGAVFIEDCGSKNGIFVNSVRVERERLREGDLLTIGETQFRFRAEAAGGGI